MEGRQVPEKTEFFSFQTSKIEDGPGHTSFVIEVKEHQNQSRAKLQNTTVGSNEKLLEYERSQLDESCIKSFQDFIRSMPQQNEEEHSSLNMSHDMSMFKNHKVDITPSMLMEKEKYVAQTNWLSECEVQCTIDYNSKQIATVCRIKDAELQFQNGGCSFRLSKISKMKVLFQNYHKCICFVYDDLRGKKTTEIRFKIYIENDTKDDLYLLFGKIVVEKLMLMDYVINLKEGEDLDADKFIMKGQVWKKGQVIDRWSLRKLVLTDRIQSFKDDKMTFEMTGIREMWTRFDIHKHHLIIKLRHGKEKTQLAIPLVNYSVKFCKNNWLYRIFSLLTST